MFTAGGENVYPAEVESVPFGHPAIAKVAAVIGLPDERWGEAVIAVVVAKQEPPILEELREFAGRALARYKLPTPLQIVDVLPRNPAGKVFKFEPRDRFVHATIICFDRSSAVSDVTARGGRRSWSRVLGVVHQHQVAGVGDDVEPRVWDATSKDATVDRGQSSDLGAVGSEAAQLLLELGASLRPTQPAAGGSTQS